MYVNSSALQATYHIASPVPYTMSAYGKYLCFIINFCIVSSYTSVIISLKTFVSSSSLSANIAISTSSRSILSFPLDLTEFSRLAYISPLLISVLQNRSLTPCRMLASCWCMQPLFSPYTDSR